MGRCFEIVAHNCKFQPFSCSPLSRPTAGLLNLLYPGLASHLSSISSLPPLHFHRKRQGIFTSGTFEPVTITLNTREGEWGKVVESVLVLPKESGKGRNLLVRDIHGIHYSSGTLKLLGQTGDLLFQGNKDDTTDDDDVDTLKTILTYARDHPTTSKEDSVEPRFKNVADKTLYFGKREIEMKAREKKAKERKAKFVKEAGGLKYTALAMAKG